jgi:hypothetical protein
MVKTLSNKRSSAKYDVIVKAKATSTRIVDINNEIVRLETNGKGQVTGKYYSGVHWDTVESTILSVGSATLAIKYLHVTKNGESIAGTLFQDQYIIFVDSRRRLTLIHYQLKQWLQEQKELVLTDNKVFKYFP